MSATPTPCPEPGRVRGQGPARAIAALAAALGKRLRTACSAGGAVKDGMLEVQGDHRSRVVDWLSAEGWKVKLAGG